MTSTRRRELAAIFGLFILIALAYHNEPNNAFVLDDMPNILEVSSVHITDLSLENLYIAGKEGLHPRRILPNISFAIDWWRGNGSPRSFLWTNLIIHITNGMLVFLLIRLILRRIGQSDNYILISAFVGAALWALHPIQVQSVTYIVQRMASMATLFMLLSVFGYLYARLEARSKLPWFVISGISFFLGMLSKENAVITPLLILLAEYGVCRNHSDLIRSRIDVWFLLFPLLILFYVVIDLASGAGPLTPFVQKGYTTRDFTLARIFILYRNSCGYRQSETEPV